MCAIIAPRLTDAEFAAQLVANIKLAAWLASRHRVAGYDDVDLMQETLLLAWSRRGTYEPSRPTHNGRPPFAAFVAWCFRSVRCRLSSRVRRPGGVAVRLKREQHASTDPRSPILTHLHCGDRDSPSAPLEVAEVIDRVGKATERLADYQRHAVVGRMAGVPLADLWPGTSRQCAEQRHKSALRDMKPELAKAFGED